MTSSPRAGSNDDPPLNIFATLQNRFAAVFQQLVDGDVRDLVEMIRPSQDPKFGDYQANCAMPLKARLNKPPREIAQQIVDALVVDDICEPPQIAGPGFINLRIRDEWVEARLNAACADERIGIPPAATRKTYVIDYSAPNVAKPMHVGHIRSTVIGDALVRTLRFLGHQVIGDNHIGDWGTQFGMIIYGYKHFLDAAVYEQSSVTELARLYRLVNQLVDYHKNRALLPKLQEKAAQLEEQLAAWQTAPPSGDKKEDKKEDKKAAKSRRKLEGQVAAAREDCDRTAAAIASIEADPELSALAQEHSDIEQAVLRETAALHADDETNLALWKKFLPACQEDINRIYRRVGVTFDHTLGESFYHNRLAPVVAGLREKGIATESDGAVCVFFEGQEVPMIVQKKDGAFLYATTDLATIQYREETWHPDAILYVVDHRQSLHFEQLFATARRWGVTDADLVHVKFGTVLGEDGRPYKTRSGATVGLDGLLDEAVRKAHEVVSKNDDAKPEPDLSSAERDRIAGVVGIAALKYADLSQNRESDYVFSYDKMLALNGNTATYMQYAYARVRNIFARGNVDIEALKQSGATIKLTEPAERALGVAILQFAEALDACVADFRPNHVTAYLFELAEKYSTFYNECPVLKADTDQQRSSRLLLCELTGRTLKLGLSLLGIDVVEKM
jgi:arginyl-tRNA synthetase